jgi:hypothetical protein
MHKIFCGKAIFKIHKNDREHQQQPENPKFGKVLHKLVVEIFEISVFFATAVDVVLNSLLLDPDDRCVESAAGQVILVFVHDLAKDPELVYAESRPGKEIILAEGLRVPSLADAHVVDFRGLCRR